MITSEGSLHIKRYLAGYVPSIGESIAFGIGNRAESLSDVSLHLEAVQSRVNLITYDFVTNKLVYKAVIPEEFSGVIYEVGLYSLDANPVSTEFSSRIITTFDSATENWVNAGTGVNATFGTTATRLGADAMLMAPAASTTLTYALRDVFIDLDGYSNLDTFSFAFNVANANTTAVKIRFLKDASNYYEFSLGAQTAGYKITEVTKSTAAATGQPSWSEIIEVQVLVTSGAGGASSVEFDAIRVEDKDSANLDYILVSRKVLAAPVVKVAGQSQDIEFSLDVSIT